MDRRSDIVLSLIYLLREVWGRTYIQKFIYLFNREVMHEEEFSFNYFRFGPYCEDINPILENLKDSDLVIENERKTKGHTKAFTYTITEEGKKTAQKILDTELPSEIKEKLVEYTDRFVDFTPTELLEYVYEEYPEVTVNSEYQY